MSDRRRRAQRRPPTPTGLGAPTRAVLVVPVRVARWLLSGLVAFGHGNASVYPWLTHPDPDRPHAPVRLPSPRPPT